LIGVVSGAGEGGGAPVLETGSRERETDGERGAGDGAGGSPASLTAAVMAPGGRGWSPVVSEGSPGL
jgi:hypothetical protein